MVFALGMSDMEAAERMRSVGREVLRSVIPGVLVINLHPQNVGETRAMHETLRAMVDDGFVPWNMAECLRWFKAADARGSEIEHTGGNCGRVSADGSGQGACECRRWAFQTRVARQATRVAAASAFRLAVASAVGRYTA